LWPEASTAGNGWTIGAGKVYGDPELQNQSDANALYRPDRRGDRASYFSRNGEGVPDQWLDQIVALPREHSANVQHRPHGRRVPDQGLPAARARLLRAAGREESPRARTRQGVPARAQRLREVKILAANTVELQDFKVGQHLDVRLEVDLGPLRPEDLAANSSSVRVRGSRISRR